MRIVLAAALLTTITSPCLAGVANEARSPTSASIPCAGQLQEFYTEGGNIHNTFFEMTLTCSARDRVLWMVKSATSCGALDAEGEPGQACDRPLAMPLKQFRTTSNGDRLHRYEFVRYVFAKDCIGFAATQRVLEAVTNRVRATQALNQIVCRDINLVDGTTTASFEPLPATAFRYVTVTTQGAPEALVDDQGPSLGNVADREYTYRLDWSNGTLSRR